MGFPFVVLWLSDISVLAGLPRSWIPEPIRKPQQNPCNWSEKSWHQYPVRFFSRFPSNWTSGDWRFIFPLTQIPILWMGPQQQCEISDTSFQHRPESRPTYPSNFSKNSGNCRATVVEVILNQTKPARVMENQFLVSYFHHGSYLIYPFPLSSPQFGWWANLIKWHDFLDGLYITGNTLLNWAVWPMFGCPWKRITQSFSHTPICRHGTLDFPDMLAPKQWVCHASNNFWGRCEWFQNGIKKRH